MLRVIGVFLLSGFILYGVVAEFIEWVTQPEEPNKPANLEATFGRIVLRWLVRGLLVLLLSVLIYAAAVTYGQQGWRAEGRVFDLLCSAFPRFCRAIGLR
ncbi:MAG: hypothetical protein D6791_06620 [Chloroflexi bacterium]|nr:MAG: hypothetical protein D6791_06620 [Chloroflexota bacterium]